VAAELDFPLEERRFLRVAGQLMFRQRLEDCSYILTVILYDFFHRVPG
jgi:hypothetical protein